MDEHDKKVTWKPRDQLPKYNCRKRVEFPVEGTVKMMT